MKGKKGESPMRGVDINTSTVPQTAKGNILSAARKRRRGGAVAPLKVDGTVPKARLDKPKRARGGSAYPVSHDDAKKAAKSDTKPVYAQQRADMLSMIGKKSGLEDAGKKTLASLQRTFDGDAKSVGGSRLDGMASDMGKPPRGGPKGSIDDALKDMRKPKRQRGGKVGADTSPMTHAAHEKPMRGHKTQPNIT